MSFPSEYLPMEGKYKGNPKKLLDDLRVRFQEVVDSGIDPWGHGKMLWEIHKEMQFIRKYFLEKGVE